MLKKDVVFIWKSKAMESFNHIKEAILTTLMLKNLDFSKYFILQIVGSYKSIGIVLTQKDENE